MVQTSRAEALSAAVAVIAASRFAIELPDAGADDTVTDEELILALSKVAGWLIDFGTDGLSNSRLLEMIGQVVGWVGAGGPTDD